jgi:hypothetical protein
LQENQEVRGVDDAIIRDVEETRPNFIENADEDTASVIHVRGTAIVQGLWVGAAREGVGVVNAGAVTVEARGGIRTGPIICRGVSVIVAGVHISAAEDVEVVTDAISIVVRAFVFVLVADAISVAVIEAVSVAIQDGACISAGAVIIGCCQIIVAR